MVGLCELLLFCQEANFLVAILSGGQWLVCES